MRSFNEVSYIGATLQAVSRFRREPTYEVIHVDSGSTDGTLDVIAASGNRHVQLRPGEYTHSLALNRAAEIARGEILVSLNADATPEREDLLERLVEPFEDEKVAGAYARQIARPDATAFTRRAMELAYGDTEKPSWGIQPFSMSCAAVRTTLWKQRPFLCRWGAGDDSAWAKWATEQGFRIAYVPEAIVVHSHNYALRELYEKEYRENKVLAYLHDWSGWHVSLSRALLSVSRQSLVDTAVFVARGTWAGIPGLLASRAAYLLGRYRGLRDGTRAAKADGGNHWE
jgi:rhamnosyltransferase